MPNYPLYTIREERFRRGKGLKRILYRGEGTHVPWGRYGCTVGTVQPIFKMILNCHLK
jgi:hypothetical protein